MIEASTFWLRVAAGLYAVGLLHSLLTAVRQGQSALGPGLFATSNASPASVAGGLLVHGTGFEPV